LADYLLHSKNTQLSTEFGNINDPEFCKLILAYSPYQIDVPENYHTDLLILSNNDKVITRQSYKFIAKMRTALKKENENTILYKQMEKMNDKEKYAYAIAFLLKSLYNNNN